MRLYDDYVRDVLLYIEFIDVVSWEPVDVFRNIETVIRDPRPRVGWEYKEPHSTELYVSFEPQI